MVDRSTAAVRLLAGDKEPVRLASTANLSLSGLLTVDGVVAVAGDRILVKDQTDPTANGIYTASVGLWRRAPDAATSQTLVGQMKVAIREGTANGRTVWSLATHKPNIGTDAIVFTAPPGGYGATSDTPLLISVATKTFDTQSWLDFRPGQRVRLISRSDPTDYMEGEISTYVDEAMQVAVDFIGPGSSGTHNDWDIVVAGARGTGDLRSDLNLSDLSDPAQARINLGISQSQVFTPEQYGGGPAVADNAAAFIALSAAVRAAGGGTIALKANATYIVYPNTLAAGFYTLFDLSGTRGVVFNGNGAKISTPTNFVGSGNATSIAISLDNVDDITINDFNLEQTGYNQKSEVAGFIGISLHNRVVNTTINNLRMNGGRSALWVVRDNVLAQANRAHSIVVNNPYIRKVAYPFSFQKNGDQVTIRGARTEGADRCYFCYNVHQHYVEIQSDANTALQDVVISNSYNSSEDQHSNTTAGITLRYHCEPQPGWTAPNAFICITFQSASPEGRNITRNIDINMDINNQVTTDARPVLLVLNQTVAAQSRLLENVRISGSYFTNAAATGSFMELFIDKDWTGDVVSNFQVEDFTLNSAGSIQTLRVDGRAIQGPFTLRNISGSNGTSRAFSATNMTGKTAYLTYAQAYLPTAITP
jgi:hypothetical protein